MHTRTDLELFLRLQRRRTGLRADRQYFIANLGGKTYTMGTNTTTMDCNEEGMIPKVIRSIFD
jgi:hypothetical protein